MVKCDFCPKNVPVVKIISDIKFCLDCYRQHIEFEENVKIQKITLEPYDHDQFD